MTSRHTRRRSRQRGRASTSTTSSPRASRTARRSARPCASAPTSRSATSRPTRWTSRWCTARRTTATSSATSTAQSLAARRVLRRWPVPVRRRPRARPHGFVRLHRTRPAQARRTGQHQRARPGRQRLRRTPRGAGAANSHLRRAVPTSRCRAPPVARHPGRRPGWTARPRSTRASAGGRPPRRRRPRPPPGRRGARRRAARGRVPQLVVGVGLCQRTRRCATDQQGLTGAQHGASQPTPRTVTLSTLVIPPDAGDGGCRSGSAARCSGRRGGGNDVSGLDRTVQPSTLS